MSIKKFFVIALFFLAFVTQSIAQVKKDLVKYASARDAIYALIDTVSKSGINSADWLMKTKAANKNLKADLDNWMNIYGEALTNVKPWTVSTETIPDNGVNPALHINFTTKNGIVFVLVRGVMRDVLIKSLSVTGSLKPMEVIKMLGSEERISWEQQEHGLILEKPESLASQDAIVFKISFQEYYKSTGTVH
ncbi:MAG: hypothetical protein H7Y07_15145 [Pyrinomonadaceae bacterium]|nr:hypothetical protein [Sphingobacteriaceae bacterium]